MISMTYPMTPPATSRLRSASPFVVSMAVPTANWLPTSTTAVAGFGVHADQALQASRVVPTAKVRDAGIGTKQDRPPRGEPR
ncbi:MAG TPA: hypothetical protein VJ831_08640 [Jatrophihabitantaceae bacterium]|nr:hypothetical protein [Jatrophihabitantaceae bacterium]